VFFPHIISEISLAIVRILLEFGETEHKKSKEKRNLDETLPMLYFPLRLSHMGVKWL
jgi:hypothetical protein